MNAKVHERLATVDRSGRRLWVYADIIKGEWRKRRKLVAILLIMAYLSAPWLHWNGLPLVQFDFLGRRLIFLGSILGFNESSVLLTFILGLAFAIFGMTSLAGRIWCGWACPQTVFLDFIFRPIEKWLEGRPLERQKRDREQTNFKKIKIKTAKWSLYVIASFIIANTFVAYFSGSSALLTMILESPLHNPILFCIMLFVFAGFVFNFGWFREQMCTLVCPYGRLQSVLLDKDSYIIGYNTTRGEPRRKSGAKSGDCVDCLRCVQVCPTGIDIRNGLQLECINCSACIDACNLVMSKINKPKNLIGYTTENILGGRRPSPQRFVRPAIYLFVSAILISLSVRGAYFKDEFHVLALKGRSLLVTEENNLVRNQMGFLLSNQSSKSLQIKISSDPTVNIYTGLNPVTILPGQNSEIQIFVQVRKEELRSGVTHKHLIFEADHEKKDVEVAILGREEKP